jgi:hypothetical protein
MTKLQSTFLSLSPLKECEDPLSFFEHPQVSDKDLLLACEKHVSPHFLSLSPSNQGGGMDIDSVLLKRDEETGNMTSTSSILVFVECSQGGL